MKSERYAEIRRISATDQELILSQLLSMLKIAAERLQNLEILSQWNIRRSLQSATLSESSSLNGSLDVEFHIVGLTRASSISKIIKLLGGILQSVEDTFVTMAILFSPTDGFDEPPNLPKFRSIYYANTPFCEKFVQSQQEALALFKPAIDKAQRKPDVLMVHYHWNPIGIRPARDRDSELTISLNEQKWIGQPDNIVRIFRKLADDDEEQMMQDI